MSGAKQLSVKYLVATTTFDSCLARGRTNPLTPSRVAAWPSRNNFFVVSGSCRYTFTP